MSFHPPESLGFQQLYVDAETKFSKEPLHSFVTTSIPQGERNMQKPSQSEETKNKRTEKQTTTSKRNQQANKQTNKRTNEQTSKQTRDTKITDELKNDRMS